MPHRTRIPRPAARRLSLYLRELVSRLEAGEETVSSKALGLSLGLTDAQVRKDLALFGQFGHPGRGYAIPELVGSLRRIMGRDREWRACVVGTGNIGRALLSYDRFRREGFRIVAAFDADPRRSAEPFGELRVQAMADLPRVVAAERIELGIVCVPRDAAQQVADALVAAGVRGILNFAPRRIDVREGIAIVSVDFTVALEQLAFQVSAGAVEALDGSMHEGVSDGDDPTST